jgi:hypothetical protein
MLRKSAVRQIPPVKKQVLPERAVALCLAGAALDDRRRVFSASPSEVSPLIVVALRGGLRD